MPMYSFEDSQIAYIGRWAPYEGSMTATAPGSRFRFAYEGQQAILHFHVFLLQQPAPHLYIRVDNGAMVEVTLERYVRVQARGEGRHTVEVILKSMVEAFPRWHRPLVNRCSFLGVEVDALVALPRPQKKKKTIEFVGDSITEGVLIDAPYDPMHTDQYDRPFQDDVTATYAWLTAESLGLEPLVMGYGAVGVTKGGQGGVPKAAEAYPYCFEGAPVTYGHPDYVLINHGSNDGWADSMAYTAGYVALLDAILQAHPRTQVIAMSVFNGTHAEALQRLVAEYNERHGQHILFVDGSHWLPKDPLHPLRDGHRIAAEKLTAVLREKLAL